MIILKDSRPIGVTGASGRLGRMIITKLLEDLKVPPSDIVVTTLGLNQSRVNELIALGLKVKTNVNYTNDTALRSAFMGIKRLLIMPTKHIDNFSIALHTNPMRIAAEMGVRHIVYITSPTNTSKEHIVPSKDREVENVLKSLPNITWSLLAENIRSEELLQDILGFIQNGSYYTHSRLANVAHVAKEDTAYIAALVLASGITSNGTFDITGPDALTREQVTRLINKVWELDPPIEVQEVDNNTLIMKYRNLNRNFNHFDSAAAFSLFDSSYASGIWSRVGKGFFNITGRQPETFENVLLRNKHLYYQCFNSV